MYTVVETPAYLVDAEHLFSPEERSAIIDRIAGDPTCGVVISGSGGVRKQRREFARICVGSFRQKREGESFDG